MRNGREATKSGYSLGSSPNAGKLCALLCTDTLPPPLSFPLNAAFRAWGAAAPGDQRDRPTKGVRLIPHTPFHSGSRSHIRHNVGRRNHSLQEVAKHHPNTPVPSTAEVTRCLLIEPPHSVRSATVLFAAANADFRKLLQKAQSTIDWSRGCNLERPERCGTI